MGHSQHSSCLKQSHTRRRMLGRVVLLSLVGLACSQELPKRIMEEINKGNLQQKCFGRDNFYAYSLQLDQSTEQCKQLNPLVPGGFTTPPRPWTKPAAQGSDSEILSKLAQLLLPNIRQQLRRNKRQAGGLLDTDGAEFREFLDDFDDFKMGMMSKISNLTCVLTQMNMLDSNMQPNLYMYTTSFWEQIDYSDRESAVADPEWRQKMINSYNECQDLAQAWPQQSIDRNEMTKMFGRQMVFFKCAKTMENANCAKHYILKQLEFYYGKVGNTNFSQFGLPRDKYDTAALSLEAMYDTAPAEELYVHDFFWSKDM